MFDFDATLPLMALQFILLAVVLNAIFYKPLSKVLDERAGFLRSQKTEARERLAKAENLTAQYEQQLGEARRQSQDVIASAQGDAKRLADEQIAEAQRQAQAQREQAAQEIEQEKQAAMAVLEQQVEALSRQILEKLLGPELVIK
jgi:F-type H+-transporting ATPase subunit b